MGLCFNTYAKSKTIPNESYEYKIIGPLSFPNSNPFLTGGQGNTVNTPPVNWIIDLDLQIDNHQPAILRNMGESKLK
jgi:hypothetical protein